LRVLARPLTGNTLTEAWLREDPAALDFYPGSPRDLSSFVEKAREVDARFDREGRAAAAAHLVGGGDVAAGRLRSFVEDRGFMVTTGQQPGLFGGPLYGLYKGLTAAALARRLEAEIGRPVLPVFWIASEDHGWDEVRGVHVLDAQNELHEVALPDRDPVPSPPLHRIQVGSELEAALEAFLALHPETDFSSRWEALLRESYGPDRTLSSGFQRVMETLFASAGVFLVQAHDPGLKQRSLPVLLRELEEAGEREAELARLGARIQEAGFELQVPLFEGATNLFLEGPEGRERLFTDGSGFRLRGSGTRLSTREIRDRVDDDPSVLSPNVLLRPVVESTVFPTLSYVAGPGEAAYLPQTAPVFRGHGVERPIVHPRVGITIVESKVDKVLRKFRLELDEMARPHHELAGRLVREDMPGEVNSALSELRSALGRGASRLGDAVRAVDPTLGGPVDAFRNQGFGLLEEVEKKVIQQLKRENEIALAQVGKAQLHLFPLGKPQERVLNPFYYLVRYDEEFLERLWTEARAAVLP